MAKVLAIIGSRDSGKTTVGAYLARCLTEKGYRVGAIKHVHNPDFTIDVEGKDTWRYRHAGAEVVTCVAQSEIIIFRRAEEQRSLEQILSYMGEERLDVVLLEGLKTESAQRTDIYKVVTANTPQDLEETVTRLAPPILAATGLIAKKENAKRLAGLPLLDIEKEGNRLLDIIIKKLYLRNGINTKNDSKM